MTATQETGTHGPIDWQAEYMVLLKQCAEYEQRTGGKPNVLYVGVEEHLAMARQAGLCTFTVAHDTGHLQWNGWRVIRVVEKNWLELGRYNGPA